VTTQKSTSASGQSGQNAGSSRSSIGRTIKAEKGLTVAVNKGLSSKTKSQSVNGSRKNSGGTVVSNAKSVLRQPAAAGESSRGSTTKTVSTEKKTRAVGKANSTGRANAQANREVKSSRSNIGQTIKAENKAPSASRVKVVRAGKSVAEQAKVKTNTRGQAAKKSESEGSRPNKGADTSPSTRGDRAKVEAKSLRPAEKKSTGTDTAGATDSRRAANMNSERSGKSASIGGRIEKRAGITRQTREAAGSVRLGAQNGTSLRTRGATDRQTNRESISINGIREKTLRVRRESRQIANETQPVIAQTRDVISSRRYRLRSPEYSSTRRYREVTDVADHVSRHEHVYVDRYHRTHYRTVRPSFYFGLHYNWGPYRTCRYFYPYYHRRYVFVSLGGYWPIGCTYRRYYWYGYHPYHWYGYYPIAYEMGGDTYNYYTYNYYDDVSTGDGSYDDVAYVDHTTFADVRERLAIQQPEEPAEETMADRYFDDAVKAFEIGGYATAAELFAEAMAIAPDDMILPFAYAQALFANEQYIEAAEVLRTALAKVTPEMEGVFYPRGLYTDEDVLYEQINGLIEKAELYGFDGDLQLLLGYHMLGIGEIDAAIESLRLANQDFINAPSAAVLLSLAEKLSAEQGNSTN
jgi:hypothetical protein